MLVLSERTWGCQPCTAPGLRSACLGWERLHALGMDNLGGALLGIFINLSSAWWHTRSCWETAALHCTRASAAFVTLAWCFAALEGNLGLSNSSRLPAGFCQAMVLPGFTHRPSVPAWTFLPFPLFHHLVLLFLFTQRHISPSTPVLCPWATERRPPPLLLR